MGSESISPLRQPKMEKETLHIDPQKIKKKNKK